MRITKIVCLAALISSAGVYADQDWSGKFAGIDFGSGFKTDDNGVLQFRRVDGSDNTAAIGNAFGGNFDGKFESGILAGGHIGLNAQNDSLVYGLIADVSAADIAEEQSAFSATPATYIERREANVLATLRGRLGFPSDKNLLPYLTAGLAYGDVEYSWEGNSGAFRGDNGENGDGLGYAAGGGVETKLADGLTLGAEYLFYDLGDAEFETRFSGEAGGALAAFGNAASGGTIAFGSEEDFTFQTLKVNASWSF